MLGEGLRLGEGSKLGISYGYSRVMDMVRFRN